MSHKLIFIIPRALCHANEWVMSHIWMSHVTHTNEPCRTYGWGTDSTNIKESRTNIHYPPSMVSHTWVSIIKSRMQHVWTCGCVTLINKSQANIHHPPCNMSHIQVSHITHINESCHTYDWVMSHTWISHTLHNYEGVTNWYSSSLEHHATHVSESKPVTNATHIHT